MNQTPTARAARRCEQWINRAFVALMLDDVTRARALLDRAAPLLAGAGGGSSRAGYVLLDALIVAGAAPQSGAAGHDAAVAELQSLRAALAACAGEGGVALPPHMLPLVDGELAHLAGDLAGARERYEEAADTAAGFAHHEGYALERLARLLFAHARADDGLAALDAAGHVYEALGARSKAAQLRVQRGASRAAARGSSHAPGSTGSSRTSRSSRVAVLEVVEATQAMSAAIERARVLEVVIDVARRSLAADAGALLLATHGTFRVAVRAAKGQPPAIPSTDEPLDSWTHGARGVALAVIASQATTAIDDVRTDPRVKADGALQRAGVGSLVCMPILKEGTLVAVLVLESAAPRAFTPERVEVLEALTGQMAVSLENARLYDELSQALHEAQESARLRSEFLANTSHELRTPLNALINLPQWVVGQILAAPDGEPNAEEIRALFQSVVGAGIRLHHTVDGILELSRLESGAAQPRRAPMTLQALFAAVSAAMAERAAQAGIALQVGEPPALTLQADAVWLGRMLKSLVDNAIKFSSAGQVVEVGAALTAEGRCELHVRDAGIGIPLSSQQLIFESFRQVSGGHTRAYGGAGVGLAIAKRLVELHGGGIAVASAPGEGSTFRVWLPTA